MGNNIKKIPKKLSLPVLKECADIYLSTKLTFKKIAKEMCVTESYLRKELRDVVRENGRPFITDEDMKLSKIAKSRVRKRIFLTKDIENKIIDMHKSGKYSPKYIIESLGISSNTYYKKLREYGLIE